VEEENLGPQLPQDGLVVDRQTVDAGEDIDELEVEIGKPFQAVRQ
jgi:hypothetical protein